MSKPIGYRMAPKPFVVPKEKQEQIRVATYLDKRGILYFAVPNQRRCGMPEMVSLKQQGLKPGVQDLIIMEPKGVYHGMAIEMKRRIGGILAQNQKYWNEALNRKRYNAVVAKGAEEAINMIERYMALKDGESL